MAKGKIKIEGDASSVKQMLKDIDRGFKNTAKEANKSTKDITKSFGEMSASIKSAFKASAVSAGVLTGALYLVDKAIMKIGESNMLIEKRALANTWLKTINNDLAIAVAKTAEYTNGMLQARDAIFMMNEATLKGIKMNGKQYADLMRLSTKLAVLQGKEVKEVFEGFTVGVARLSPQIQENTGITIKNGEVLAEYAKKHKTVASALDDETRKQVILNKMIEEGRKKVKDLTDFDIQQGLIVAKQYSQYLERKAQVTDDFYSKMGKIAKDFYSAERQEMFKKEAMEKALIIVAKRDYSKLYTELLRKHKDWTDKQIANSILMSKQGSWGARKWVEAIHKAQTEVAENMLEANKKAFELKVNKNKINHFMMDTKRAYLEAGKQVKFIGLLQRMFSGELKAETDKANKEWWEKNKQRVLGNRKEIIRDIIKFEKEKIHYSSLSNEEKLKADEHFSAREKALLKVRVKDLKGIRIKDAKELDKQIKDAKDRAKERLDIEAQLQQMSKETLDKELKDKKDKHNAELKEHKEFLKNQKKLYDIGVKAKREAEKHKQKIDAEATERVLLYRDISMSVLNAIIDGNAEAIPKILAQKAFFYGTDTFWKGVTDVAKGMGYSADPLMAWAGPSLITAGYKEIAEGAALMAIGGVASYALGDTGSSGGSSNTDTAKSDASKDRFESSKLTQDNREQKQTPVYLYPSEKEWLNKLKSDNKKLNNRGL